MGQGRCRPEDSNERSITLLRRDVAYLSGVITTLERAERAVDGIEPVVERCAFNEVASLQEEDGLRVRQAECVLQVEVALSVEVETSHVSLVDACDDQVSFLPLADS